MICRHLNARYKGLLVEIDTFMTEQIVELGRPINDLEDVRGAMKSLEAIRMKQDDIDQSLSPVEVVMIRVVLGYCLCKYIAYIIGGGGWG